MATAELLKRKFEEIGAEVVITEPRLRRIRFNGRGSSETIPREDVFRIDVVGKRGGNRRFSIESGDLNRIEVLDTVPDKRHLLLAIREAGKRPKIAERFLCGHDERDWFSASVRQASNVKMAMEFLKPTLVLQSQKSRGVKSKDLLNRHTKGSHRQGEWFFIPVSDATKARLDASIIHRNEPFSRPRGTPHRAQEAVRDGGYSAYTDGLEVISSAAYHNMMKKNSAKASRFTLRTLDSTLYVRGKITHPDHRTVELKGWHQVVGNSELSSGRNVFID